MNDIDRMTAPEPPAEAVAWIHATSGEVLTHHPQEYGRAHEEWTPLYTTPPSAPVGVEADYVPGELDRTAPPRIWLQIDTSADNSERDDKWPEPDGVSWCWESIGGLEIQYVRADLAQQPAAVDGECVDWRAMYRFQTAMRYMDNNPNLSKQKADRMADDDVAGLVEKAAKQVVMQLNA